jgi:methylated-DNA-[protein]-cysteine S-methyltransferase
VVVRAAGPALTCRRGLTLPGIGPVALSASAAGLARVDFLDTASHDTGPGPGATHLDLAARELLAWARGGRHGFTVALDLAGLPPFLARVLEELRRQPYGTTVSYGALAARCGNPRAARAVGQAMARNPLPIVIPCHRVVAGDGIGGFTPGLALKRALWAVEGLSR